MLNEYLDVVRPLSQDKDTREQITDDIAEAGTYAFNEITKLNTLIKDTRPSPPAADGTTTADQYLAFYLAYDDAFKYSGEVTDYISATNMLKNRALKLMNTKGETEDVIGMLALVLGRYEDSLTSTSDSTDATKSPRIKEHQKKAKESVRNNIAEVAQVLQRYLAKQAGDSSNEQQRNLNELVHRALAEARLRV